MAGAKSAATPEPEFNYSEIIIKSVTMMGEPVSERASS